MRARHHCERLGWNLTLLARLARQGARSRPPPGGDWQDWVFQVAAAIRPYLDIQGPGYGRMFGAYGASGMAAEIDTAVDDGMGILTLVESKANDDYQLYRDAAFVFSGKIREREAARHFRWNGTYAVVASVGRLDAVFCRWCFYEGIDVLDPDRFPLIVLARLPFFLSDSELEALENQHLHSWLSDTLQLSNDEIKTGPMLLRGRARRGQLREGALHDLNEIQANLSESLWSALLGRGDEQMLLDRAARQFDRLNVVMRRNRR